MAPVQAQKAMAPLQFIQADLFKTGMESNGMKYVCVFEDRFTKLCRLYALRDAKARSVAKCIEAFVGELGCPDVWGTDGGPEFYNVLTMAICHVFQIKKEFALAYRPQTQGQTERKNRTLKAELAKRISQFGRAWPSYLKWIEMAYNCTPHPSHGYTPFLLMFGREAKLPMQSDIPKIDTKGWQTTMKSYLSDFLDRMAAFQKQAVINRTMYQVKLAQKHDKNLLEPLQPGEKVLRDIPGQFRAKLDLPKDGPWEVEEQRVKEGRVLPVYRIRNEENKIVLAHRESLSPFIENNLSARKVQSPPRNKCHMEEESVSKENDCPAMRTRARKRMMLSNMELSLSPQYPVGDDPDGANPDDDDPDDDPDDDDGDPDIDDFGGDDDDHDDDYEDDGDGDDPEGDGHEDNPDDAGEEEEADAHSEANSANQFSEIDFGSPAMSELSEGDSNTPENSLSGTQSGGSSNYATPESLNDTAIEVFPDDETVSQDTHSLPSLAPHEKGSDKQAMENVRPSVASTSSFDLSTKSLADVFDSSCSADEMALGHVVTIVTNKLGVPTEVRRSARSRKETDFYAASRTDSL